jgi:hypothetical protein
VARFQYLFAGLYLPQPDGTVTSALVTEEDLRRTWRGRMLFDAMIRATSGDVRLLRVSAFRLGGGEERRYVSLGHDALARVAKAWKWELSLGRRLRRIVAAAGMALLILAIMACLTWYAWHERQNAERALKETQRQLAINDFERGVTL